MWHAVGEEFAGEDELGLVRSFVPVPVLAFLRWPDWRSSVRPC